MESDKKYKAVHIIFNLSLGGAQILLFDIISYLNLKNDIENYVVTIDSGEYISLVYKYLINRNSKFKSKTEVIYNGIEKFREDFEKKKREKFTIGNIGRLTYLKGQEYLI